MEVNRNISSWGKTSKKEVKVYNQIDDIEQILPIGNLNSYGDSCIPRGNNVFEFGDKNLVNTTILEYTNQNKKKLFGIPGKANVTLGGAIASDVHGKDNLWGGTFSKNIEQMSIQIDKDKIITTSRTENKELFYSTIGGLGLTGLIVDIQIINNLENLKEIATTIVEKGEGLASMFKNFEFEESCYWSCWLDLVGSKQKWISYKTKEKDQISKKIQNKSLFLEFNENKITFNLSNKLFLKNLNYFYYIFNKEKVKTNSIYETLYPIKNFYDTRYLAGREGLIQIQFVIPVHKENEAEKLLSLLTQKNNPILCSVKRITDAEGILSFCKNGWTFALDFSKKSFNPSNLNAFYKKLIEVGGSIYLAKDSLLDEENFLHMYPQIKEWRKSVQYFDPKNKFQSSLSNRLGIKNW